MISRNDSVFHEMGKNMNGQFLRLGVTVIHGYIITSVKEVMFLPGFVWGFVSLFVNKITQKLMDGF